MTTPAPDAQTDYLLPQSVVSRGLAYIVDTAVVALISVSLMAAGVLPNTGLDSLSTSGVRDALESNAGLAIYLVLLSYFLVCEGAWGRTAGKRLLGMTVVRVTDGQRCGWGRSTVRNLVRPLDLFFIGLPGALLIMFSPRRQRVGDMLGGTLVVRRVAMPAAMVAIVPGLLRRCPQCGRLAPAAGPCTACAAPAPGSATAQATPFGHPMAGVMAAGQTADAFRTAAQETLAAEAAFGDASAAETARLHQADGSAEPTGERPAGAAAAGDAFVHTEEAPGLSEEYVAAWRRLMSAVGGLRDRRADLDASLADARVTLEQLTAIDPVLGRVVSEVGPYLEADDDEAVLAAYLVRSSTRGGPSYDAAGSQG